MKKSFEMQQTPCEIDCANGSRQNEAKIFDLTLVSRTGGNPM
jgi:hypothetical protein